MYTQFYGFDEKPFNLVPNPDYLFLSPKHKSALTFLEYGVTQKIGFVMLTGEIGIGKTTLIRHILNQLDPHTDAAVIFNTNVDPYNFIRLILSKFDIEFADDISKAKAIELLYRYLIDQYAQNKKVLLIIDEAQNLSNQVLEELRMLSNLQTDTEMLLQVIIVGQPELEKKIKSPELEQFAQRIAVSYHLDTLDLQETKAYIQHRVQQAGRPSVLFSDKFIKRVYDITNGIPRTINRLCDASLVYGYADGIQHIDVDTIDKVMEERGGMGIITKTEPAIQGHDNEMDLNDRVTSMEAALAMIKKEVEHTVFKEERLRNQLIIKFKKILAAEKNKYNKLAEQYNQLKEKYQFVIKNMPKN